MTDEAALLQLARVEPDSWLVYGDWLEGRGEDQRAAVVRLHRRMLAMTDDEALLEHARELLALAENLPRAWLQALAAESIAGTCWGARDHRNTNYMILCVAGGVTRYRGGPAGDVSDIEESERDADEGWWMQIGRAVTYSLGTKGEDYSRQDGVVIGDRMWGIGSNAVEEMWTWELARLPASVFAMPMPELPESPADVRVVSSPMLPRRRWR